MKTTWRFDEVVSAAAWFYADCFFNSKAAKPVPFLSEWREGWRDGLLYASRYNLKCLLRTATEDERELAGKKIRETIALKKKGQTV